LLVVSLWRGPVPVCHLHASAADPADVAGPSLAAHLQSFHAVAGERDLPMEWHWHLMLPGDLDGDGDQDTELVNVRDGALLSLSSGSADLVGGGSPWAMWLLGHALAEVDPCQELSTTIEHLRTRDGLSSQFHAGVEVRLLACVALC
jgi:hypothetical protein